MAKQKTVFFVKWFVAGTLIVFFFSGCGLWGKHFSKDKEREKLPNELMSEAVADLESGYYEKATEEFQKIKDRYPYSKFAIEAEIKMADALYRRQLYDEAFEAYNEFERLHPKNQMIPYVIYQKGMCNFTQVSTIDRDQSHTFQAKEDFERLVKKFPETEYASRARRKIRACYINLAEYELYVGHYYFRMGRYRAAMNRYRYILENYPDLGQYNEALEYYSQCKEKLPQEAEARERQEEPSWVSKLNPFSWWDKSEPSEKEKLSAEKEIKEEKEEQEPGKESNEQKKSSWVSKLNPFSWWNKSESSEKEKLSAEKEIEEEKEEQEPEKESNEQKKSSWWRKLNPFD